MSINDPEVSVVAPVYGCRECLEDLVDRVCHSLRDLVKSFEIVLVDDASPDGAWQRISELARCRAQVRGLRLTRNFGQHYAISAGIESARGTVVVVMDCDLQDVPEEIPRLLDALRNNPDAAVVFGQRTDRNDSLPKRFSSWAFYRILTWLTGVKQDHTTANFGAYRRRVIDAVNRMPERDRCFPLMVRWTGYSAISIPVEHAARQQGRSAYSLKRLITLASEIVLSYSDKPLRLVVRMGLLFSAVAAGMVGVALWRYYHGDIQVAGFTSVIASIWLVGGAVLFCLGVVGLYVGRQFNNAKGRPYYLIAEETPGNALPAGEATQ